VLYFYKKITTPIAPTWKLKTGKNSIYDRALHDTAGVPTDFLAASASASGSRYKTATLTVEVEHQVGFSFL
jgi:hypothetical protein